MPYIISLVAVFAFIALCELFFHFQCEDRKAEKARIERSRAIELANRRAYLKEALHHLRACEAHIESGDFFSARMSQFDAIRAMVR